MVETMNDDSGAVCLITADAVLEAAVARLAAAAGASMDVVTELVRLPTAWNAPVVLLGADLVRVVAAAAPPRRDRVYVVGSGPSPVDVDAVLACGAEAVLSLPTQDATLMALLADLDQVTRAVVIGVVGGSGGAGATTFATALAQVAARAGPTLLVDADVHGAGVDQVLGLEPDAGVRWDALLGSTGRLSGRALRDALPRRGPLSVLAWPVDRLAGPDPSGVREVVAAAVRGFAAVVVDLPRGAQAVADELRARCDRWVVVAQATVPGLVSTARLVHRMPAPPAVVVLRRRTGGVDPVEASRFLGVSSVVVMGDQRGLDEDVALGAGPVRRPRGALTRAAADVASLALGPPR